MKTLVKFALLACSLLAGIAHSAFPERPVTFVVPYAPGGAANVLARVLAVPMASALHTEVIVDNRPGASGMIGKSLVARSSADGYTVLFDATASSINPSLFNNVPFNDDDFKPVSLLTLSPNVLVVPQDSPIKDQKDLIARAKAQPGKLTFGSGGGGTLQRMAGELYRQELNLDVLHVPYKSGGPAITAVMSGEVDFMFGNINSIYPIIASGRVRALAITSAERSPLLPDVPTVAESVLPGYEAMEWTGLLVPKGTSDELVELLNKAVVQSLKDEKLKKVFNDAGATPIGSSPKKFAEFLKTESEKWAQAVRKGNIKIE